MEGQLAFPIVSAHSPEKAGQLERVLDACRRSVAADDFALCRARIAGLHGVATDDELAVGVTLTPEQLAALDRWWASDLFSPRQRALLGFVEQFVFDVSSMGDQHVDALLVTDEPVHVHELANVVWALDLVTRMNVVSKKVLS